MLGVLFLVFLSFVPVGRTSPGAHLEGRPGDPVASQPGRLGGGVWKPLAVDSGYLFEHRIGTDFFAVYEAGALLLAGRSPYLADPDLQVPVRAPWCTAYRYLPIAAFVFGVPLNVLPPWWAYLLWIGVYFVCVVGTFLLCVGRRPDALLILGVVWLCWFPMSVEWYMGQFTQLMALLLVWGMDGISRGRSCGGWLWAVSVAVKIYPCAMALPLWVWKWHRTVLLAGLVLGGSTVGFFLASPGSRDSFQSRGVEGRVLMRQQQPYAGAQGMQAGVNAALWSLQGRSFGSDFTIESPRPSGPPRDVVTWSVGILVAAFGLLVLSSVWVFRRRFHPVPMGLFWLIWFFAYRDVWEHHFVLVQALVGFWLVFGVLKPWQGLVVWLGAGTPSLWVFFHWAQVQGVEPVQTLLGLLYFWQRPAAILFVTAIGAVQVWKAWRHGDRPGCGVIVVDGEES